MKSTIQFLLLFIILSCNLKTDVNVEKINKNYFADYRVEIDTIGKTENYILNSYTIHLSAIHREYFNGITTYNKPNEIYKVKLPEKISPKILNEKLILVNNEFFTTRENGIWWNWSNPKNIEYYINPFYSRKGKKINALKNNTENLEKGIYYLEHTKLKKVENMDREGNYYLTQFSLGIVKEIEIDELIKQQ